ncbi:MAG: Ig-like domain-containing protein [Synergistaceae bacterium]|nr:Ig-like domain-containing protein [Synergistaceae bacterium]
MKKIFLAVTIIMALCFIPSGALAAPDGTPGDPFEIYDEDDLNAIRDDLDKYYILSNNIDLSGYLSSSVEGWLPIGDNDNPFTGGLDGNSFDITGLWISRDMYYVGLFGYTLEATIENLSVDIAPQGIKGKEYVGGLVGTQMSEAGVNVINNCYVNGSVSGDSYVGGLVGRQSSFKSGDASCSSVISNSYASGDVKGNNLAGGLVGEQSGASSEIKNSYARNSVSGENNTGGLVGRAEGSITDCYTTGNVIGDINAGGMVGELSDGSVKNSFATGDVDGSDNIGGITGILRNSSSVTSCYATGSIRGLKEIGVLAGSKGSYSNISSSFRYKNSTLNGAPVSIYDMDSVNTGKNGGVVSEDQLKTKQTYVDNLWLFDDSAGPWVWDSNDFPKLDNGIEGFPFNFFSVPEITINIQPQPNTTVYEGSITGSLSVSASVSNGGTPTYQWYSQIISINVGGTKLEGETNASLTIPIDLEEGTHYFYCEVGSTGTSPLAAPLHSIAARVTVEVIEITGLTITPKPAAMSLNGTLQLSVDVTPPNASHKSVRWSSSNTAVASVNSSGLVRGLSTGPVVITATSVRSTDVKDSFTVTVTPDKIEVTGITITTPKPVSIQKNGTLRLEAEVTPPNATSKDVAWSSDDPSVASVNASTGLVTGMSVGTARITAASVSNTNVKDTCEVSITPDKIEVTGITISPKPVSIPVGGTRQLSVEVTPPDATSKDVTWSSSAPSVATVGETTGLVTGVSVGPAVITATSVSNTNVKDTCTVEVGQIEATGVKIIQEYDLIRVLEQMRLRVNITPDDASDKRIEWSSSREDVATINASGIVTGVWDGETTITATLISNPNVFDTSTLSVTSGEIEIEEVTIVQSAQETVDVPIGFDYRLDLKLKPGNATIAVVWSSSNEDVATVSQTGVVHGVSPGPVIITVRSENDETIVATCNVTIESDPTQVTGVTLTPDTVIIAKAGDGIRLTAEVMPEKVLNKSVTWSSSKEEVAVVNQGGWVTAVSKGSARIIATSNSDASVSGVCSVTVLSSGGGDDSGCNAAGWNMAFVIFGVMLFALRKVE